jgi:hypothetical protein
VDCVIASRLDRSVELRVPQIWRPWAVRSSAPFYIYHKLNPSPSSPSAAKILRTIPLASTSTLLRSCTLPDPSHDRKRWHSAEAPPQPSSRGQPHLKTQRSASRPRLHGLRRTSQRQVSYSTSIFPTCSRSMKHNVSLSLDSGEAVSMPQHLTRPLSPTNNHPILPPTTETRQGLESQAWITKRKGSSPRGKAPVTCGPRSRRGDL